MKVIGILLRREATLIAVADDKKKGVRLLEVAAYDPIWSYVEEENVKEVTQFFEHLAEEFKIKGHPVYLGIPDSSGYMDCYKRRYLPEEEWHCEIPAQIEKELPPEELGWSIDFPLSRLKNGEMYLTATCAPRKYLNVLWEAASKAKIELVSVEAESTCALRYIGDIDRGITFMLAEDDRVTYSTYWPQIGMVATTYTTFGSLDIIQSHEGISRAVESVEGQNLLVSKGLFKDDGALDLPIAILSERAEEIIAKLSRESIGRRLISLTAGEAFLLDSLDEEQMEAFAPVYGLCAKPYYERRRKYETDSAREFDSPGSATHQDIPEDQEEDTDLYSRMRDTLSSRAGI